MKTKVLMNLMLIFLVGSQFQLKAQELPKNTQLTFQQVANYYSTWEKILYPMQQSLTERYWSENDIKQIIEKLPALEEQMKADMKKHPAFFKLYPKELKTSMQYYSINKSNYTQYSSFAMAGENEALPAKVGVFLNFYKRYCYWRKLMNDEEKTVFDVAAKAMLEAENARESEKAEKLKYMAEYSKALKVVYPNSSKADYMIKRTSKNAADATASYDGVAYYKEKENKLHWKFQTLAQNFWDEDLVYDLQQFNFPEFYKKMKADKAKTPKLFMIYPSTLMNSGMGTITKKNVDQFTEFGVAGENEKPPQSADAKAILSFYKEYSFWKLVMKNNSEQLIQNLRKTIIKADNSEQVFKYDRAVHALNYARTLKQVCPDNSRIDDLVNDAEGVLKSSIAELRPLFSGKFHENHLSQIFLFKNKPVWGKENESQITDIVKVGQPVWITGFFTSINSMGLPTLLIMNHKKEYAKGPKCWGKTDKTAQIPMFDQLELKAQYKSKAYFTFNLFPDIDKTNYKSHVEYFPHLNFVKWLTYQPAEVLELKVRWGKTKNMAEGIIKIDLSGDNKQKLKDYYKKLEAKRLSMVTYPDMNGTNDATSRIINFSDLSKYGKVLRITMSGAGNIMKPFPHDDQVDWNTAKGFMAVEKSDGKVIIMPLDFRKRPSAAKWQWWSIGSIPDLYPAQDYGFTEFNSVIKINGGYEILKENVNKSSTWYIAN